MPCCHSLVSLSCKLPALLMLSLDRMSLILKPGLMVSEGLHRHMKLAPSQHHITQLHKLVRPVGVMTDPQASLGHRSPGKFS